MDCASMGFKCGLEIHQRLDTSKLFCNCSCDPNKNQLPPSIRFRRRLRAVASELGELDPTARFEAAKGREFLYLADAATSCLVEADEEPPHALNPDALQIALQACAMLGSQPLDEISVMRKQVLDGSSVSGFQRTALIALGGSIATPGGPVRIASVCLEEESSGIVDEESRDGVAAYRLDRQGIPLIEIATEPDIVSPGQAHGAAVAIGTLLRSLSVQRGLGTIRQDVNVSISGGARVEIKGAQELNLISKLVENEALRQHSLVSIKAGLSAAGVHLSAHDFILLDVTELFSKTAFAPMSSAIASGGKAIALRLPGFAGFFARELALGHTLGREVAGCVRMHSAAKGFIHSDEDLGKIYGISVREAEQLRRLLGCSKPDLFALCFGPQEVCLSALSAVFRRASAALRGVPKEVRKANGPATVFLRPMPGSARMYPETDVPPVRITPELLDAIAAALPEQHAGKKKRLLAMGLNDELAGRLVCSKHFALFEKLLATKADPSFIAVTLLETLTSLKRAGVATEKITEAAVTGALLLYSSGKITKSAVAELLKLKASHPHKSAVELVKEHHLHKFTPEQLKAALKLVRASAGQTAGKEKLFVEMMKRFRFNVEPSDLKRCLADLFG
ncbi:MAG: Glu-tRNA(Gln) amidotransferase subunit GatE [Candidatus Micrarchaeota archaeon]